MPEVSITSVQHLRLINDDDGFVLAYVTMSENGQRRTAVAPDELLAERGIDPGDIEAYIAERLKSICETSPMFVLGENGEVVFDWWFTMRRHCGSASNAYMTWRWQYSAGRETA